MRLICFTLSCQLLMFFLMKHSDGTTTHTRWMWVKRWCHPRVPLPHLSAGRPYRGKPSDMWALGVVLFTMLYGQFPFYDSIPQELFRKIKAAEYSVPEWVDQPLPSSPWPINPSHHHPDQSALYFLITSQAQFRLNVFECEVKGCCRGVAPTGRTFALEPLNVHAK